MDDATQISDELAAHLWQRRHRTIHRCRVSALYHLKRERFFDSIDKLTSAVTAITATAAVGALLKSSANWDLWASAATAALSLIPLVFNPAASARHHGQLAAEYRRLLAECALSGERWAEHRCDQMAGRVLEIEAGEPAPLAALLADCENQIAIASGSGPVARLRWYERMLKHWLDIRPDPMPDPSAGRS